MAKPTQAQINAKNLKIEEAKASWYRYFQVVDGFQNLLNTIPYDEITDAQWDRKYATYLTLEAELKTKITNL